MAETPDERAGFARARSGDNAHRSFGGGYRRTLFRVKVFEEVHLS
jgi:hypothetical protein